MKLVFKGMLMLLVIGWLNVATAELQLLPDRQTQCVFAGGARKISLIWQNTGDKIVAAKIRAQIFQASSATAVLLAEMPWKRLQVLPGQTILESVQVDFPTVNAETKFLIQWLADTNEILGVTKIWVYPTNLLAELKLLAGDTTVGIFDLQNELKPLLKNSGIEFEVLESSSLEDFSGKLAIVGAFPPKTQPDEDFVKSIKTLAKKNIAVVWIWSPPERDGKLVPSFYLVPESTKSIVVVQPDLISDLSENPQSQQNLICLCKLALNPQPLTLPNLFAQP